MKLGGVVERTVGCNWIITDGGLVSVAAIIGVGEKLRGVGSLCAGVK